MMMTMPFRQALIALGACTLLIGGVSAVIESPPASAASGKTPTITKVTPSRGTTSGNTVVTITGTNLGRASSVALGTHAHAAIVADSSTKLTVIDPSLGAGPVDVMVTLANGHTSPLSNGDRFTYVTAPGTFPTEITGTFTDNFTFFDDDATLPPAETSTTGSFTLKYAAPSCRTEPTDGLDAACYEATSVSGTGLQACYPPDNGSPTLEPFSFGTDAIGVTARIQVDTAGAYHLYFDLFASSAAGGPVKCPDLDHDQNSVIALFHDPDGKDTASPDAYAVGQRFETVNVQDNGEDQEFGNGITAPGWSGSATFAFAYGSIPVVSGSPAGGTVGTAYLDKSIAVSGGTSPYTVTATGLPPGLTIKSSGTISGTPSAAGTYTPTITATDSSKPPKTGTETPTIVIAQG
jgi:large repetitive protein